MTEAQLSTAVIENPEMLKYQRRQQQQQLDQKNATARETSSASSVTGVVNGESLEDIRKVRACPRGTKDIISTCTETAKGMNRWNMAQEAWTGTKIGLGLSDGEEAPKGAIEEIVLCRNCKASTYSSL